MKRRLPWIREREDASADAEIRHHIRERADRLIDEGWDPDEAEREAERRFGDVERVSQKVVQIDRAGRRRHTPARLAIEVLADARHAIRSFRRAPVFSLAVTLALALGIGATTAIFTLVDGVLLAPLPVRHVDRLVRVYEAGNESSPYGGAAYPTFVDYREGTQTLEDLAAWTETAIRLRFGDVTDRVSAALVTGDYFDVLGVDAALGRVLSSGDDRSPGESAVVVLSHRLWIRLFQGDPSVVGKTVELTGGAFTVVGVAPDGFRGVDLSSAPDVWIPLSMIGEVGAGSLFSFPNVLESRVFRVLKMVGRRGAGVSPAAVEAELNALYANLEARLGEALPPEDVEAPITVVPAGVAAAGTGRPELLRFVALLSAVVLLMLAIACANVANLMLARASARVRELGVRQALGAGRGRVVRQLLVESSMLGLAGGAMGLLVARGVVALLGEFALPGGIELASLELALDRRVLLFAFALSLATAAASGLAPALGGTRIPVVDRLRGRVRGGARGGSGMRTGLVIVQVALSTVLLVGAALFARSVAAGMRTDLGFEPRGLAALGVRLEEHGYDEGALDDFIAPLLQRAQASPAVRTAAAAIHVPVAPPRIRLPMSVVRDDGQEASATGAVNVVLGPYFEVMGLGVVEGRSLLDSDRSDAPRVAVVSRATARAFWPTGNAVGREITLFDVMPLTVVGVVEDHRAHTLEDAAPQVLYLPAQQNPRTGFLGLTELVVRGASSDEDAARAALTVLHQEVRAADPRLPVSGARLVAEQLETVLMPQRFALTLLGVFASVALLVAGVGVHGVVAYTVGRRTREIGIRRALGARSRDVARSIARATGLAVVAGLVVGLSATAAVARLTEAFLYGVAPRDPLAFALGTLALALAAAVALALPTRRALRVEPREALGEGEG